MNEKEEPVKKKSRKNNNLSQNLAQLIMGQGVAVKAGPVKTTIRKGYIVKVSPKDSNDIHEIQVTVKFLDGGKIGLEGCEHAQEELKLQETYDAIWLYQDMVASGLTRSKAEKANCKHDENVRLQMRKLWQGKDGDIEGFLTSSSTDDESKDAQTPRAASKPPQTEEAKTPSLSSSPGLESKFVQSLLLSQDLEMETDAKPKARELSSNAKNPSIKLTSKAKQQVQLAMANGMTQMPISLFEVNRIDLKHHRAVKQAPRLTKKQRKRLGRKAGMERLHDSYEYESKQMGYFMREFKYKPPQDGQKLQTLDEKVSMIDQRVARKFHGTLYFGTIDLFRPAEPYGATDKDLWRVLYDDGEMEDYEEKELLEFRYLYCVNRSLDPCGEPV